VSFPEPRRALLTTSWGRLGTAGAADKTCPNRAATPAGGGGGAAPALSVAWAVACGAGGAARLRVTSAASRSAPFRQGRVDVPVLPGADPACRAAVARACAGATAALGAAAVASATLPAAAAAGAAAVGSSSAGGGCRPSPLGYQCLTDLDTDTGVRLHYTVGGADPPPNACTRAAAAADPAAAVNPAAAAAAAENWLHFAAEAPTDGYVALAFPAEAGTMSTADAVIGWVDVDERMDAAAYALDAGYRVSRSNAVSARGGGGAWATRVGSARGGGGGGAAGGGGPVGGGRTAITCFSRPRDSPAARHSPSLDPSALKLNWAVSRRPGLVTHARSGGMTLDLARGAATGASALTSEGAPGAVGARERPRGLFSGGAGDSLGGLSPALAAHGLLGMLAFGLLMPLGMLLSRHKWLFGPSGVEGGNKGGKWGEAVGNGGLGLGPPGAPAALGGGGGRLGRAWLVSHALAQVLALACALAALLAVLLGVGWDRTPPSASYSAHRAVGIAALALALLQALAGALLRPRDVSSSYATLSASAAAADAKSDGDGYNGGGGKGDGRPSSSSFLGPALARDRRRRARWLAGHRAGGWLAAAGGWAAVFLGCAQMVAVRGAEPAWWFAPAGALLAVFVVAMAVLEAFKRQMELTGRYCPRSREVRRGKALLAAAAGASGGGAGAGAPLTPTPLTTGGGGGGGGVFRGGGAGGSAAAAGVGAAAGGANGHGYGRGAGSNGGGTPAWAAAAAAASAGGGGGGGGGGGAGNGGGGNGSSPYHSAGGASAAPSAGTVYHTAGGGSDPGGGGGPGAFPDIVLGGSGGGGTGGGGGGGFLPTPPAV